MHRISLLHGTIGSLFVKSPPVVKLVGPKGQVPVMILLGRHLEQHHETVPGVIPFQRRHFGHRPAGYDRPEAYPVQVPEWDILLQEIPCRILTDIVLAVENPDFSSIL